MRRCVPIRLLQNQPAASSAVVFKIVTLHSLVLFWSRPHQHVTSVRNVFTPHLIKDLQVEGVHPRGNRTLDHFVPPRVLGSIVSCWGLIDRIAQSDPTIWIHPGHPIVFSQFGLLKIKNRVLVRDIKEPTQRENATAPAGPSPCTWTTVMLSRPTVAMEPPYCSCRAAWASNWTCCCCWVGVILRKS